MYQKTLNTLGGCWFTSFAIFLGGFSFEGRLACICLLGTNSRRGNGNEPQRSAPELEIRTTRKVSFSRLGHLDRLLPL